jgi:hypothetical protein
MFYYLDQQLKVVACGVEELIKVQTQNLGHVHYTVAVDHPVLGVKVSTVFTGVDVGHDIDVPHTFETMVFVSDHTESRITDLDQAQVRYVSFADALDGHARMCDQVLERLV